MKHGSKVRKRSAVVHFLLRQFAQIDAFLDRMKHSGFDHERIAATISDVLLDAAFESQVILQSVSKVLPEAIVVIFMTKPQNLDSRFLDTPIQELSSLSILPAARQANVGKHKSGASIQQTSQYR